MIGLIYFLKNDLGNRQKYIYRRIASGEYSFSDISWIKSGPKSTANWTETVLRSASGATPGVAVAPALFPFEVKGGKMSGLGKPSSKASRITASRRIITAPALMALVLVTNAFGLLAAASGNHLRGIDEQPLGSILKARLEQGAALSSQPPSSSSPSSLSSSLSSSRLMELLRLRAGRRGLRVSTAQVNMTAGQATCAKHGEVRSKRFMRLDLRSGEYNCRKKHPCDERPELAMCVQHGKMRQRSHLKEGKRGLRCDKQKCRPL
eukprot:jgi/Bigna1/128162/aug1.6_g2870